MSLFNYKESDWTNRQILYVIGNGFDIHHGIESSFNNFRDYLKKHNIDFLTFLERHFGYGELWQDFEKSLGRFDINEIFHYCSDDIEIEDGHEMRSTFQIEDSTNDFFAFNLYNLNSYFNEWVRSININFCKTDILLLKNAKFLTFNYTETLERIYNIPENNILHIHGNRLLGDTMIIGHDNYLEEYSIYDEQSFIFEENAKINIINATNQYVKPIADIIYKYKNFFYSLNKIDTVIFLGFSYSMIDYPYIEEVYKNVNPDCIWYFSEHGHRDIDNMKIYVEKLKINRDRCLSFFF